MIHENASKLWKICEPNLESCFNLKDGNSDTEFSKKRFPYFYLYEYVPKGDFKKYPTNQLIYNFQLKIDKSNQYQLPYKKVAIEIVRIEYSNFLNNFTNTFNITPTQIGLILPPCSERRDQLRFSKVFEQLNDYNIVELEYIEQPQEKNNEDINKIKENLRIKNNLSTMIIETISVWFFIDDVISSGASYRASSEFLQEKLNISKIYGLILSKTVHNNKLL